MTDPLFAALPGPVGDLRRLLDGWIAEQTAAGSALPADLVLVVQSLADRIDTANATRQFRGFVMLTAEYRAARRDLAESCVDVGPDPLDALLADFHRAESDHPAGSVAAD